MLNFGQRQSDNSQSRAIPIAVYLSLAIWFGSSVTTHAEQKPNVREQPRNTAESSASELEVAAFGRALTNQLQFLERKQQESKSSSHEVAWAAAGIALLGMLVMLKYVPRFLGTRGLQAAAQNSALFAAAHAPAEMAAEEKSFADFAARFRVGPHQEQSIEPTSAVPPPGDVSLPVSPILLAKRIDPVAAFFAAAPGRINSLRELLAQLENSTGAQALLTQIASGALQLKNASQLQALTPIWQLTSSLEALANQLSQKTKSITPSTFRTISAAVDLIEALARPGLDSALGSTPPIRVLAVDDDPISRHAISFALKKALNLPDLAASGPAALELAQEAAYDAIFLDVQMPEMDGFELCRRLHETERNRNAPVVFITCQDDFAAREKSTDAGGCDLIGKPFLTFEVTLKALTLVLKTRNAARKPLAAAATQTLEAASLALAT